VRVAQLLHALARALGLLFSLRLELICACGDVVELFLQESFLSFDVAYVLAAVGEGVAVARCVCKLFFFFGQVGLDIGEEARAARYVGYHHAE
jgi:hypothetical protein